MDELRCRLIRQDGSEWTVRELIREGRGLRVDAVPAGDGHGNGSGPPADGDGAANGDLSGEPLARGDRIQWRTEDGRVVWSMRVPLEADGAGTNGGPGGEDPPPAGDGHGSRGPSRPH